MKPPDLGNGKSLRLQSEETKRGEQEEDKAGQKPVRHRRILGAQAIMGVEEMLIQTQQHANFDQRQSGKENGSSHKPTAHSSWRRGRGWTKRIVRAEVIVGHDTLYLPDRNEAGSEFLN